jgi:hypothetical protein
VATVDRAQAVGEIVRFVLLPGGSVHMEEGDGAADADTLVRVLGLTPPVRVEAVRRSGSTWAVGGRPLLVVELGGLLSGDELEIVWDGTERSVRIDGEPRFSSVPEVEALAGVRFEEWVARAERLRDDLWEVEIDPL